MFATAALLVDPAGADPVDGAASGHGSAAGRRHGGGAVHGAVGAGRSGGGEGSLVDLAVGRGGGGVDFGGCGAEGFEGVAGVTVIHTLAPEKFCVCACVYVGVAR